MKGVTFLKGVPVNPVTPEIVNNPGSLKPPGQSMLTANMAMQSSQTAQQAAAQNNQVASQGAASLASTVRAGGTSFPRASSPVDFEGLGKSILATLDGIEARKQEEAKFDFLRDAELLRRNAADIISSDGGMAAFDRAASNLFMRYRGRVPYEDFEAGFTSVTNTGKDAYSTVSGRLYQQQQELKDASTAMAEAEVLMSLNGELASLGSVDPVRRQEAWTTISSRLEQMALGGEMDLASTYRVSTAVLTAAREADIQPEAIERQRERFEQITGSVSAQREAYARWLNSPQGPQDIQQFDLDMQRISAMFPDVPIASTDPNAYIQNVVAAQRLRTEQQEAVLADPDVKAALEGAQDFSDVAVQQLAFYLAHPGVGRAQRARAEQLVERAKSQGIITDWPSIIEQSEVYTDFMSSLPGLNAKVRDSYVEYNKAQAAIAEGAGTRLARWRSYAQPGSTAAAGNLGLQMLLSNPGDYGLDPNMLQALQSRPAAAVLTPEEAADLDLAAQVAEEAYLKSLQANYTQAVQDRTQAISPYLTIAVPDSTGKAQTLVGFDADNNPFINNNFFNALSSVAAKTWEDIQTNMNKVSEAIQVRQQQVIQQYTTQPGVPAPFNTPPLQRQTMGGVETYLPLRPSEDPYIMTGEFGEDRRTHNHAGTDIYVKVGTEIINYIDGTVEAASRYAGYGLLVDVRDDRGLLHRFAHLSRTNVQVGQRVKPGDVLALSGGAEGDPNAGTSTGPHLHWEVRVGDNSSGSGGSPLDPLKWASQNIRPATPAVRGATNPSSEQHQGVPLSDGGSYRNGLVFAAGLPGVPGRAVPAAYTASLPMVPSYASPNKSATTSSPDKNYGYAVLAQDNAFRVALHDMAKRLDIPAQWIADIMDFESKGFNPSIVNPDSGAYGLIQFMEPTIAGLKRNHPHLNEADLRSGNRVRQLRWVEALLSEFSDKVDTVYDLAVGILLGEGNLTAYKANPDILRNDDGDGNVTPAQYVQMLGITAGRQYQPMYPVGTETHVVPHSRCRVCQRMGRAFQPHGVS